jgi:hypothetical protein
MIDKKQATHKIGEVKVGWLSAHHLGITLS